MILSRSLGIEPGHRVFSDQSRRPTILTGVDADSGRVEALSELADVAQVDSSDGAGIVEVLGWAAVTFSPLLGRRLSRISDGMRDAAALRNACQSRGYGAGLRRRGHR